MICRFMLFWLTTVFATGKLNSMLLNLTKNTRLQRGYPSRNYKAASDRFASQLDSLSVSRVHEWKSLFDRVSAFTRCMLRQVGIIQHLHPLLFPGVNKMALKQFDPMLGQFSKSLDDAFSLIGKDKSAKFDFVKKIRKFSQSPSCSGVADLISINVEMANSASSAWRAAMQSLSKCTVVYLKSESHLAQYLLEVIRSDSFVTSSLTLAGQHLMTLEEDGMKAYFKQRYHALRVSHIAAASSFHANFYLLANPAIVDVEAAEKILRPPQASVIRFHLTCAEFDRQLVSLGGRLEISEMLERFLIMDVRKNQKISAFIADYESRMYPLLSLT